MSRERRHFTGSQKRAILRERLIERGRSRGSATRIASADSVLRRTYRDRRAVGLRREAHRCVTGRTGGVAGARQQDEFF